MNDQKNTEEDTTSNTAEENSKTPHIIEASFAFLENEVNEAYKNQKPENESFSY